MPYDEGSVPAYVGQADDLDALLGPRAHIAQEYRGGCPDQLPDAHTDPQRSCTDGDRHVRVRDKGHASVGALTTDRVTTPSVRKLLC